MNQNVLLGKYINMWSINVELLEGKVSRLLVDCSGKSTALAYIALATVLINHVISYRILITYFTKDIIV